MHYYYDRIIHRFHQTHNTRISLRLLNLGRLMPPAKKWFHFREAWFKPYRLGHNLNLLPDIGPYPLERRMYTSLLRSDRKNACSA